MPDAPSAYQLKITLVRSKPPIWRRVVVPSDITLDRLHDVLQITFGWLNCHLHVFEAGERSFGLADPDGFGGDVEDERGHRLRDLAAPRQKLLYEYDFGDSWDHEIRVEKEVPLPDATCLCLAGERAAPPEDAGGVWGYEEKLAILANPKARGRREIVEWMGKDFDPEAFDLDALNGGLRRLVASWRPKKKASKKR